MPELSPGKARKPLLIYWKPKIVFQSRYGFVPQFKAALLFRTKLKGKDRSIDVFRLNPDLLLD